MMAMDRNIPHVRDIFAPYRGGSKGESRKTEVCVYDYSPGSRRRNQRDDSSSSNSSFSRDDMSSSSSPNDFIETDHSDSTDTENSTKNEKNRGRSPDNRSSSRMDSRHSSSKKNNSRSGILDNHNHLNHHHNNRTDPHYRSASVERDGSGYSSKTLTDKDIKHLERHLSMKKTIRKQISRNLAQAFVEDPKVLENDAQIVPANNDKNSNYTFTLTRAKVAKSEPTFLDMLKDPRKETDSGHSSPSHQMSYDDIEHMEVEYDDNNHVRGDVRGYDKVPCPDFQDNRKNFHKDSNQTPEHLKKGSFWKKFAFKGKAKR